VTILRIFLLLCAVSFTTNAATAQDTRVSFGGLQADTSLPVEVTADSLDVNQDTGEAVFLGNVLISQGEMTLSAPRVLVVYNSETRSMARLEATGGVTLVNGPDAAEANRADYTIESGVIVMTGDVLLTQGPSALTSDKMTVNLETGSAQMVGRVSTILRSADE